MTPYYCTLWDYSNYYFFITLLGTWFFWDYLVENDLLQSFLRRVELRICRLSRRISKLDNVRKSHAL